MGDVTVLPEPESGFDYETNGPLPTPGAGPREIEASPTSSLGSVRGRLRKQKEEAHWADWVLEPADGEPGVLVDYRAIGWEELEAIRAENKRKGNAEGILNACDVLIGCCLGIYVATSKEDAHRDDWVPLTAAEPTTFSSSQLGEYLSDPDKGLHVKTARQCVRNLYPGDGQVVATSDGVVKFSGYLGKDAQPPN